MPAQKDFAANLDLARKEAGLTLREIAATARTSIPYVHRVIAGEICPSLETAERLALAVGHPLTVLVRRPKKLSKSG